MARLRRRFHESLGMILIPLICVTITVYFGYSSIFGARGLIAWNDTSVRLAIKQQELASLRTQREKLEHRIQLLDADALDPDMLEEVARSVLAEGPASDVAIPRAKSSEK